MYFFFSLIPFILLGTLIYYGTTKYKLHFDQAVAIPTKLVAFLGTVILGFNVFLFESNPGLGWSLFFAVFFAFFFQLFPKEKRSFFVYFLSITGVIAALALAGRVNDFMEGINLATIFFSTAFLLVLHSTEDAQKHIFAFIRGAWASFFAFFRQFGGLYTFAQKHKAKGKFNILQILKTAAITVLIVVIFVSLLNQADPVFAQIMEDFFGNLEERFFFSLIIAALIILGLTISIKPKKPISAELGFLNYYDFIIPLSVLITLLGVFLAIQFTYLFGGHTNLEAFDLTYSEYVRKGFIELLIATFFGSLVSIIILLKQDHLKAKENKILKIVHFVLLIELFLMLVSAFKRDIIYIDSYGLTRIRIIGGVFLAWLAAFFVIIIGANFTKKVTKKTILTTSASLGFALFLVLNTVNIDQFIVDYNMKKFPEKKDIFYTSLLSADAVRGWEDAILIAQKSYNELSENENLSETEKEQLAEALLTVKSIAEERNSLFDNYGSLEEMKDNDYADIPDGLPDHIKFNRKWQSLNFGEKNAFQYIKEKPDVFEQTLNCLEKNIDFYQIKNSIDLNDQTRSRLNEYDYPLTERFYYYNDFHSIKRDIFEYFLDKYYEKEGYKYYHRKLEYEEEIKPLLEKIKSRIVINENDLSDYQKRDSYYAEFEKHLVELVMVEKCQ